MSMTDISGQKRPRGRPVSPEVDLALKQAALAELTEVGFHAMSMESIAQRAGVSKVSLYKRWNSKLAVTAEVLQWLGQAVSPEDHGDFSTDIAALLSQGLDPQATTASARFLLRLMGEISGNPDLLSLYRTHILLPRLAQLRPMIERARSRGDIAAHVNTDVAVLMIAGPLFMHYLTTFCDLPMQLPPDLGAVLTSTIISGIGAPKP